MSFKINKFNSLFFLFLSFGLLYLAWPIFIRAASPDAIAVRIVDNPMHYSSLNWYQSQNFVGSPQIMQIDGYEAVRNGRTVYINVANITDQNSDGLPDFFNTNIFIISYNQDAQGVTSDIFGQLLKNFKFNTNLTELGTCNKTNTITCLSDSECPASEYCNSKKAKVVRDVKRLGGLSEIRLRLDAYKKTNNSYPNLKGGTYIPNKTLSTWPSWQQTLGKILGANLPLDPINKLGDCPGYDPNTCWDELKQTFATDLSQLVLPTNSHVYLYQTNDQGNLIKYCAQTESNYANLQIFNCFNDKRANTQPTINAVNLTGHPKKEFVGYASISDLDGDPLKLTVDLVSPEASLWPGRRWQWDTGLSKFSVSSLSEAGQRKIHAIKAGNAANPGYYKVKLTLDDGQGESNSIFSKIYDVPVIPLPASLEPVKKTIPIGKQDSMTINGTDSNQDPFSRVYFKSASINDVVLTEAQLTSHGFVISGNSLIENYQSAQRTGTYNVNVYALDPIEVDTRIDSSFTYTITNTPPVFEKLTATFINNTSQTCNPGDQCLIAIDNGEAAKITVSGTDPDNHNLNYSLVDNFGGKLSINAVSGVITGLENINFKQLAGQTTNISVKIADSYCNNSTTAECSVIYSFDLLVEKYCSVAVPESTTKVDIAGPININQSGQRLETGLTLNDCSSVGTSTADIKLIGESHSQAIVLISDLSGSMNTNVVSNGTTERAVNRLKKALTTSNTGLFDRIYELAGKLPTGYFTKLGLVAFNSTVVSTLDLTDINLPGSLAALKNTVNLYSAYSGTNTLLGLNKADEMLTKITDPKVEKIVILMSDGIPAVDGRKDVYYCSKKDPSCYCGGTAGNCNTPPSCGSGGTYNQAPDGNSCVCFCYCGTAADGKCNPTPSCAYNEYSSVNWGVSCSCVAGACDDKCASGSYPNCNYPNCLCGYDENTCQCLPDTCQSVFDIFFKKTLGFFNIFKTKSALAETAQTQCISTCSKPDSCASDEVQGCYASGITPNCDITTDVDAEATALKNSKVSIYTIYYNTSGTAAPKQKMCNWSSNNGTSCDNNTFSFAGTDIDTMITKVLARIVTKPKDVLVDSSVIIDNASTDITSSVSGADITGLTCGPVRPVVTYTNNGYLEFTNLKLNYCEAKLHS